jgi:hypothetical protein
MLLRLYRTGRSRYIVGAAVFGGLTGLTHPEALLLFAMTFGLLALMRVRDRAALLSTLGVATGVFVVMIPWLLFLASHGRLTDLANAGSQGVNPAASFAAIFMWHFTDETYAPAILALGLLGALALVQRRSFFIVLWLLIEILAVLRGAATFACIPLVLAASVGLYEAIGQGMLRIPSPRVFRSAAARGVLLLVLCWSVFNDVDLIYEIKPPFDGVSSSGVATMAWLKTNTPADAKLAVVSGQPWPNDVYGEWLPALTDRVSVATIQGREWVSRSAWDDALVSYNTLQTCVYFDADCLVKWTKAHPEKGTGYVYVLDSLGSHALLLDVEASPHFEVIHKGDDGVVARLVAGP